MDEQLQDRIDEYLMGRMNAADSRRFERDLESEVELLDQYEFTRLVKDAVVEQAKVKQLMQTWDSQEGQSSLAGGAGMQHPSPSPHQAHRRRLWYWVWGIASVAAVVVAVVMPLRYHNMARFADMTATSTLPSEDGMRQIRTFLHQKDFTRALQQIRREERRLERQYQRRLFLYGDGGADTMVSDEEMSPELKALCDDLKWLKVHALLGLSLKDDVKSLLEELMDNDGEYQRLARSLYEQLFEASDDAAEAE